MTECHRLSDQMPRVAHGAAGWSAEDARHLAECHDCRMEWALVRRVARLGRDTVHVDDGALIAAVLRRLAGSDPATLPAPRRRGVVMALAAAASIALLIWNQARPGVDRMSELPAVAIQDSADPEPRDAMLARIAPAEARSIETTQLELSLPELHGLDADELEMILEEIDRPFQADELPESPSWGEVEREMWERGFSVSEG